MPSTLITRTHLELRGRAQLLGARTPSESIELVRQRPIDAARYRVLYRVVGDRWHWRDRLLWSDEELNDYLAASNVHVWTAQSGGDIAGYFELRQQDADVEIVYFGLAPSFISRGIGGWFLKRAAEESFALGASRVILNTCTLDGPHALPNYLARGFSIVRNEEYTIEIPDAGDLGRE